MHLPISDIVLYGLLTGGVFGLLGAGGSILIWPLLVVVLGHAERVALAESLAIVGGIATTGMLPYLTRKQFDARTLFFVGCSSCIGSGIGAFIGHTSGHALHRLFFMCVVWIAAWSMLRIPKESLMQASLEGELKPFAPSPLLLMILGLGVGMSSGLTSVGGGFLLVPALVLICHLPMRLAIGTSLMIIACNALSGLVTLCFFCGDNLVHELDYPLMLLYMVFGTLGCFISSLYAKNIPQEQLRFLFGLLLIALGAFLGYQTL